MRAVQLHIFAAFAYSFGYYEGRVSRVNHLFVDCDGTIYLLGYTALQ